MASYLFQNVVATSAPKSRGFRHMGQLQIVTPDEPGTAAAITSFRLHGDGTKEGNGSYVRELLATVTDCLRLHVPARQGAIACVSHSSRRESAIGARRRGKPCLD